MNELMDLSRIVIPFDNSPSARVALRTAVNFAGRFQADLSFVHVRTGRDSETELEEIRSVIEKLEGRTGLKIDLIRPEGRIDKEVVRVADSLNADIIIMGTHGIKGFDEFWVGSNAFRVVSSSPNPVMTMQESYPKEGFDHIIIPIDDSNESRQKIPMTIAMAKSYGAEVTILGASRYEGNETQQKIRQYVRQAAELVSAEDIKVTEQFHFGANVADSTLTFAKGSKADLIIMMSESEPTVGLFMGSNAQRVVNHSPIPVLTLKAKEVIKKVVGY